MSNRDLVCKCCSKKFIFSVGEQKFFKAHNLSEPRRCPVCRTAEKRKYEGWESCMGGGGMRKYTRHGRGYFQHVGGFYSR